MRASTSTIVAAPIGTPTSATTSAARPRSRLTPRRAIRSAGRPAHREQRFDGRGGAGLVDDRAVAQEDDAVGPGGVAGLVGDEHGGGAGVAARAQQPQDHLARGGVERAGRLVGEHEAARADERAGDRHALLLAAGHLVREAVGELVHADLARAR